MINKISIVFMFVAAMSLSAMPPDLKAFWHQFQAAVQKGDTSAVANLTRFPLKSPLSGGNVRDAEQLKKSFDRLVRPEMRQVINLKTPEKDSSYKGYVIDFCDEGMPIVFGFEKVKGKFLWTYIAEFH